MTIRHFRVFNEVCKCMNMTQASKSLHVSQPSISKTIVELEDWYQVKLFERIGKKLFLTDAGKLFYKHEGDITDPNLISEYFATAETVAVCSQKHPFYFKEEFTKEDLMHAAYIVRELGSNTRVLFDTVMQKLQIPWTPAWICSNTQAIKNATVAGHGIGVLSKLSVRRRLLSGEFKRIPIGNMRQSFSIVYQKEKFMSKLLASFKQHIIQSFDDINL